MPSTVVLSPASGSFPFPSKSLVLPSGSKVLLGSTEGAPSGSPRVASSSNGWIAPQTTEDSAIPTVTPLPLSASHAQIWSDGGKVYVRDLESAFGTFVNGTRISKDTILKTGDVISLGSKIPRNGKTPAYITDLHLSPVIARVSM